MPGSHSTRPFGAVFGRLGARRWRCQFDCVGERRRGGHRGQPGFQGIATHASAQSGQTIGRRPLPLSRSRSGSALTSGAAFLNLRTALITSGSFGMFENACGNTACGSRRGCLGSRVKRSGSVCRQERQKFRRFANNERPEPISSLPGGGPFSSAVPLGGLLGGDRGRLIFPISRRPPPSVCPSSL